MKTARSCIIAAHPTKLSSSGFMFVRVLILSAAAITTTATNASESVRWETYDLWANQHRYITIKNIISLHHPRDDEPFQRKADICTGIIRSNYIDETLHVNTVDINDEDFRKELRDNYPRIFAKYYSGDDAYTSASMKQLEFVNPYDLRFITVVNDSEHDYDPHKTFELSEWVFSCLARHRHVGKVVEFFISSQYQLAQSIANVPTRIIFGPDIVNEYKEDLTTIVPIGESWIPQPGTSYQECIDRDGEQLKGTYNTSDFENKNTLSELPQADLASDGDYHQRQESEERKRRVLKSLPNPFAVLLGANYTKKSVIRKK